MISYLVLAGICAWLFGVTMLATTFPVTLDKKLGATLKSHSSQIKYLQQQTVQANSALVVNQITLEQHSTQIAAATATANNALPLTGGTLTGALVVNANHTVNGTSITNGNHTVSGYVSVGGAGAGSAGDVLNTGTVHTGGVSAPTGTVASESASTSADISVGGTAHTAGVSNSGVITSNTITTSGDVTISGTIRPAGIILTGLPSTQGAPGSGTPSALQSDLQAAVNRINDLISVLG